MSFHNWLHDLRSALVPSSSRRLHRRRRSATLQTALEKLEDRCLLSFDPITSFPVGMSPQAIVTADFNSDGQPDLATANAYDNTVTVLLGNADGSFQPARTSATGPYPISLAAGDFNADGKLDLATANWDDGGLGEYGNNAVNILLGNGDGTFAAPVVLSISEVWAYPWSIATGDLNADGKLDLVVTSDDDGFGGYVDVLLGHGDGSFPAAASYGPHGIQIFSPALADFNGDGKVDVAVAGWQSSSVKVFLGNGDGTLRQPSDFATDRGSNSVAAGDFNADGKLDLVTANYSNSSNSVSMLLGNGDGTFQMARFFAAGNHPQSATASDVNGDGKLDLVVTNASSTSSPDGAVSVLLGNGDGSLAPPITNSTGGSTTVSVVMADFNGDGRPDAAAANAGSNTVSILLNDGVWDETPPPPPPLPSIAINDVTKNEGQKGKTSFTFTVTLSAPSTQTVTVNFATADGTAMLSNRDYHSKSGTLTFQPGQTSKTITINVRGDKKAEGDETFFVTLSSAQNALLADGNAVGTILNDDGGSLALDAAYSDWDLMDDVLTGRKRK